MKKYLFLFLLFILISCEGCSNPDDLEVNIANLYKSWTNSYEEQNTNENVQIFRPSNYKKFSASRYREVLVFSQDNTCSYLVVAPADGLYFEKGKWSLVDGEENIIAIFNSTETIYKKFQIIELKSDILRIILI